ncbi:hypothetical protein MASR1M45_24320 [Candidatus Kapaibacterium sp.]
MKLFPEPKEFTFFNLIRLIKLNLKQLLIFVGVFTTAVVILSLIIPHDYVASSSLMPPKKDGGGGGLSSFIQNFTGGGLNLGSIGQSDQSKVFGEIIKSRTVAEYIIDKMKLKDMKEFKELNNDRLLKFIHSSISVDVDKSGIIYVFAKSSTGFFPGNQDGKNAAEFSSNLANYAVEGLDKVIKDRNMSSARRTKEYIEKEIVRYRSKLDTVETALEEFQKSKKVLAIDEQTQAIVKQAIEVGTLLAKADLERNLASLEYQTASPQYQFYDKQYQLLSDQYRKIQSGGLTENESFTIPLDDVPSLIKEYANLFRERKVIEQVMLYLETQRHQEAIQEKRDVPVVEVLDIAYPADERSSPKRSLMVMLGLVLSLVFASFYIAMTGLVKRTLFINEPKIES